MKTTACFFALAALIIVVNPCARAQGTISTIAGNGTYYYPGNGGTALNAILKSPGALATDTNGNIFFVDAGTVRKINTAGIITNVAGGGSTYPGDGGPATAASLGYINNICLDNQGNIYTTEQYNARVRKINIATGIITTIAGTGTESYNAYNGEGGPATAASLGNPKGLAADKFGNIYVADNINRVVRKITAATGIITTIAGDTSSMALSIDSVAATNSALFSLNDVKLDSTGNLYLLAGDKIRRVDPATGIIYTVTTVNYPEVFAMDRHHNFYIPDYMSGFNIQKIDGVTDSVTIISGLGYTDTGDGGQATASQISCYNLACNRDGDVYLSDLGRVLVRKIDRSTGLLNTIAGNGNYYVADGDPSINGIITPYNMAADPAGNLFVMDKNRIRKIDAGTGIIHTVAGTGALGFSGDGGPATNAQISNLNYFMVNDYSSPIYLILGGCIAVDASGNIYFTDAGNQRVRKVDALTGNISTIAGCGTSGFSGDGGPATLSQLYYPTGIAVDSVGNIYIADNGRIRKIDAPTGNINTIALNINATSLALDLYNNIYFSQTAGNLIGRLHITTGIVDTIAGNGFGAYEQYGGYTGDGGPAKSAALYVPTQVCLSQNDDVLFTDTYNNRVRVVDHTSGNIYTLAGNGYGASTFVGWVCGAPEITFLGGGFTGDGGLAIGAELYSPTGVCTDASGSVYIADQQNYRIRKVLSPTAAITTNKANPSINLYPNPTNGLVNIKNTSASPLTYTVYNELGEKIGGQSDSTNPLSQLDLSQFPDGVYFMACSVNGVVSMHQLVVSH